MSEDYAYNPVLPEGMLTEATPFNDTYYTPDIYDTPPPNCGRYLILLWSVLCALVSIPGNTSVFVASAWYHAIRLDNISVILIRNLAAADLVYTVTVILPTIWSVLSKRWALGQTLCYAQFFLGYMTFLADVILVCTLNISKLTCLLFPLHARTRAKRTGRFISLIIWGVTATAIIPLVVWVTMKWVKFSNSSYRCDGTFHGSSSVWWVPAYSALFGLLPIIVVVVTTAWLLRFVKKVRGLQKESVVTNIAVSVVYVVALVPYTILQCSYLFLDKETHRMFYVHFYRFSVFMMWINTTGNHLIYYFTVVSYKNFVKKMFSFKTGERSTTVVFNKNAQSFESSSVFYPKDLSDVEVRISSAI
ncbi:hypothetical protein ACHWQZ_G013558 [Mnemiopsis leidyi]